MCIRDRNPTAPMALACNSQCFIQPSATAYSVKSDSAVQELTVRPDVYKRQACWSFSQDNIDKYELAISHLCQNNMAYAFPIMLLKGEDVEIQGDMYGCLLYTSRCV